MSCHVRLMTVLVVSAAVGVAGRSDAELPEILPAPVEVEIRLDRSEVHPGQLVKLSGLVRADTDELVNRADVIVDQVAMWDPKTHKMTGIAIPMLGTDTFSRLAVNGSLNFDIATKQKKGFVSEYRPSQLGVYLVRYEWEYNGNRRVSSTPALLAVRPPVDAEGRLKLKPDWAANNIEQARELEQLRSRPFGFESSLDKAVVKPGDAVRMRTPHGNICVDGCRIAWFDPKRGALIYTAWPQVADARSDLGLAERDETIPGGGVVRVLRPQRLGIYLVTATLLGPDAQAQSTSQPMLLTVMPDRAENGSFKLRPEWISPPPVAGVSDVNLGCSSKASPALRK